MLARPAPKLSITVDGEQLDGALVLLGNGKRYGGPLKVFPSAEPDDGLLDVLVLRRQTAGDVLGFLAALATGSIEKFAGVWIGRGQTILVKSPREVPVELDGEAAGSTPLQVERSEYRLRVRVKPTA